MDGVRRGWPRELEPGKRGGDEGCYGDRRNGAVREVGGRRRGRERLERRKERGGQPDKQNPCCFISARLARHRPFIRARFRPTLAATPMDPPLSLSVDVPRRTGLSTRYFSSSLINGIAASRRMHRNGIEMGLIVSDTRVLFFSGME